MKRLALFLVIVCAALSASVVRADDALDAAKALFKDGVALYEAGDFTRALDRFTRSRAAFASSQNTMNAALCLDRLGRFDEALEMFDDLVARFDADLAPDEKTLVVNAIATLRAKVGTIDVTSNVDGRVAVDGRDRGALPITLPIRALAGPRRVRVTRDGYATFETIVEVKAGETTKLDARLDPLAGAGELRVESDADDACMVLVDRLIVGKTPWQGAMRPGTHAVWIVAGGRGVAPTKAVVVQGQTTLLRLHAVPLEPSFVIDVEPDTADISLGGVSIGQGGWDGRLPRGTYVVNVSEPGYFAAARTIVVGGKDATGALVVRLEKDDDHPRWPKAPVYDRGARFFIGAFGGYPFGPINALVSCGSTSCDTKSDGASVYVGARTGVRFGAFTLEAELSYVSSGWADVGAATDARSIRGYAILVGPAASYRLPVTPTIGLVSRFAIGPAFMGATSIDSNGGNETSRSAKNFFAAPELGADLAVARFRFGFSVTALFIPLGLQWIPQLSIERTF